MIIKQTPRLNTGNTLFTIDPVNGNIITHNRSHNRALSIDRFDSYYFSGENANVYLNGLYLSETVNIQWQLTNNTLPLYGYHSYEFNHMAPGTRIVQGSLTINYTEPLYIIKLIQSLSGDTGSDLSRSDQDMRKQKGVAPGTIANNILTASSEDIYRSVSDKSGKGFNREALRNLKEVNKERFGWVSVSKQEENTFTENKPLYKPVNGGINIKVTFGQSDKEVSREDSSYRSDAKLNDINSITLIDVNLTGEGSLVDDSGKPVQEMYSFLAKKIVCSTSTFK
jgi:hypothetical protein